MDMFDLIKQLLMAYFIRVLLADLDGSTIELVFIGDAIPGTINGL